MELAILFLAWKRPLCPFLDTPIVVTLIQRGRENSSRVTSSDTPTRITLWREEAARRQKHTTTTTKVYLYVQYCAAHRKESEDRRWGGGRGGY